MSCFCINPIQPSVYLCTAQWSSYVQHSGHYIHRQFNIQQFYVLPTQCIYVITLCNKVVVLTYIISYYITYMSTSWCLCSNLRLVKRNASTYISTYEQKSRDDALTFISINNVSNKASFQSALRSKSLTPLPPQWPRKRKCKYPALEKKLDFFTKRKKSKRFYVITLCNKAVVLTYII